MIGFLLKIAILVVAGVLVYNYFLGDESEKAQSAKVFGHVKEIAVSVGDLAKSEKEKFDAGKYDTALEKLAGAYRSAREGAQQLDVGLIKRIGELEQRRNKLAKDLQTIEQAEPPTSGQQTVKPESTEQSKRKEALRQEMQRLLEDSNKLLLETGK